MTQLMIVEDNHSSQYMLRALLTGHGYEVSFASNGAEALEIAHATPPDLVVSDILMPVMDGFTLCRQWKSDERLRRIPFIFYTATYIDPKDEEFAISLGAARFLIKPAEPEVLLQNLVAVLEEHKEQVPAEADADERDEVVYLREYNQALVRKLEDKIQQLAEANRVLEAQNAELERFAYTISHEFKSPLITIAGFVGRLEEDIAAGNDELAKSDMARIVRAKDRMEALLKEALELSRIGRVAGAPENVPLGELVHEVLDSLSETLAARGVTVKVEPHLPELYGERNRLSEVLHNLIENAAKYMGDQPNPRVEIGGRRTDEEAVCFVRDNGVGIEPRYHEKIFGLFDQLDPRVEGSGIGLALVKRIVQVHGGRVWVESDGAGSGSAFYFTTRLKDS